MTEHGNVAMSVPAFVFPSRTHRVRKTPQSACHDLGASIALAVPDPLVWQGATCRTTMMPAGDADNI